MAAAIAAFRAGNAPHILQVFEVGTATMMAAKGAIKPVYEVMARGRREVRSQGVRPAVAGYYTNAQGPDAVVPVQQLDARCSGTTRTRSRRRASIPTARPQTWPEVVAAAWPSSRRPAPRSARSRPAGRRGRSSRASRRGTTCRSLTKENGFAGIGRQARVQRPGADPAHREHAGLDQEGLLHLRRPQERAGGEVLQRRMRDDDDLVGGATATIKQNAKFKFGVSTLPYYADVAGRAAEHDHRRRVAVGDGRQEAGRVQGRRQVPDVPVAAASVQAEWHQETGYLPITMAAYEMTKKSGFYEKNPGTDVVGAADDRQDDEQLARHPRSATSPQIRDVIDEELEAVLGRQAGREGSARQRGQARQRDASSGSTRPNKG